MSLNAKWQTLFFLFLTCSLALPLAHADEVSVTWNGGTGNWSVQTNWTPSAVPNNNTTTSYSVNITAAGSRVAMNVANDTIDSLTLAAGSRMNVNAGDSLTLYEVQPGEGDSNNGGHLSNAGTLTTILSKFTNSGTFSNNLTGTVTLDSSNFNNNRTLINAGSFNIQDSTLASSGSIINSGTINNAAALESSGTLINSGTINNGFGFGNSGTLINFGKINNSADFGNSGTLINAGTISNSVAFTNSGAVTISSAGVFTSSHVYLQSGGSTLVNGTLTATGAYPVMIRGGTLEGSGTVNGNVLMGGTMIAGRPGNPLTFNINGNYEQTGAGVYDELISSRANGLLNISGSALLDPGASLDIDLLGGFDPANGTSFTIADAGSLSGTFTIVDPFFGANGGQQWVVSNQGDDVVLKAEATPEPSTWGLLASGLLAMLYFGRKKLALV